MKLQRGLVRKVLGKKLFGRSRRLEGNIKMDLRDTGCQGGRLAWLGSGSHTKVGL
jgi:hypothetical protein